MFYSGLQTQGERGTNPERFSCSINLYIGRDAGGRLPGEDERCGRVGADAAAGRAGCGVLLVVGVGHRVEDVNCGSLFKDG